MTHEEITKHLQEKFAGEVHGADGYLNMAEAAERMGKYELAEGLYEMAKDEYSHADFIADTMKEHGVAASKEEWEAFEALTERIKPLFC